MSDKNGSACIEGQNADLEKIIKKYVENESDDISEIVEKALRSNFLTIVTPPENGTRFEEGEGFSFEPIIDGDDVHFYAIYTSQAQADKMGITTSLSTDGAFMFEEAEVDGFGVCVNPGDEFSLVFPPEQVKEIVEIILARNQENSDEDGYVANGFKIDLAQMASLIAWGNAFLRGDVSDEVEGFFQNNDAFSFCESINFYDCEFLEYESTDNEGRAEPELFAQSPYLWLCKIKSEGYKRLLLHSDRLDWDTSAYLGQGGQFTLKAEKNECFDFWKVSWDEEEFKSLYIDDDGLEEYAEQDDEYDQDGYDDEAVKVNYYRTTKLWKMDNPTELSINECHKLLHSTLSVMIDFVKEDKDLSGFFNSFHLAKEALEAENFTSIFFDTELFPWHLYSIEARQIMSAIEKAWVFGGMGSWNDIGFRDSKKQHEYEIVSKRLYSDLIRCLQSVLNQTNDTKAGSNGMFRI